MSEPVEIAEDLRDAYANGKSWEYDQRSRYAGTLIVSLIERTSKAEAEVRRLRGEKEAR